MLKRMKFQQRLFFWFGLVLITLLTAFSAIFYWYTGSILKENVAESQMRTVRIIRDQTDELLASMDRITIAVNSSEHMMKILKSIPAETGGHYFDEQVRINDEVKDLLYSFVAPDPIAGRISIITPNYDYTSLSNQFRNLSVNAQYIQTISWVNDALHSDDYKFFMPPHEDNWSENDSQVLSVVRPIRDNYKNIYGVIEVNRDSTDLDRIYTMNGEASNMNTVLFDASGSMIYSYFGDFDASLLPSEQILYNDAIVHQQEGAYPIEFAGHEYMASFSHLSEVDWTVVVFEDMRIHQQPVYFIRNVVILSYVLVFILTLLVIYAITRNISKPIRQLSESVSHVDLETLQLQFDPAKTNDEVALLTDVFQNLLTEIQTRTDRMLESQRREMKAHMLVWQAQINPHFLYNTLAVIGAYGQKSGSPEVAEMCSDLSNMQRYVLSAENSKATIATEVEQAERYLNLMRRRYGANFDFEICVSPDVEAIPVPKLLLQPLLENSFSHGFKQVEPPWHISIHAYREQGCWVLRVEDNGVGFSARALETLRNVQATEDSARKYMDDIQIGGLGLINTFMRLQLFCEKKQTIQVDNAKTGGAIVILGAPIPTDML